MKLVVVLSIMVAVVVLVNAQFDAYDTFNDRYRAEYCNQQNNNTQRSGCVLVKCTKDNKNITVVGCPDFQCNGKSKKAIEDVNIKTFPDCCIQPPCDLPMDEYGRS